LYNPYWGVESERNGKTPKRIRKNEDPNPGGRKSSRNKRRGPLASKKKNPRQRHNLGVSEIKGLLRRGK